MKTEEINHLVDLGLLRRRSKDLPRVRSLLESAEKNASVILKIPIDDNTSTIVFRELYECIRQLGDARWWLLGFETSSHEASMKILLEENIRNKVKLNHLDRFRQTRNNSNYRGYNVSVEKAREITEFWNHCAKEILTNLKKEAME